MAERTEKTHPLPAALAGAVTHIPLVRTIDRLYLDARALGNAF